MDSDEYFCMDLEKLKHFLNEHTYTNKMGTFNKNHKKKNIFIDPCACLGKCWKSY